MAEPPMAILLIDDDDGDRRRVAEALRATGLAVTVEEASLGREALERLRSHEFDCALLDGDLTDMNALEILRTVREENLHTQFLLLTDRPDDHRGVDWSQAGATDSLVRDALSVVRLSGALRCARRVRRAEMQALETTAALEAAVEARDTMLAVVSHDLRNPLNAFATSLALLEELIPDKGATVRRTLDAMDRSVRQMNRLLGDLLDVTRLESGRLSVELRPVGVRDLVQEAYEQFVPQARERSIDLRCETDARCDRIHGDRGRLLQVLSNLLGNAVRVTPKGGTVRVGCQAGGPGRVRLFVEDTGPGIAPEEQHQLFKPFWQSPHTARGGVGIGLAIARGLVDAHGGAIHAESRLGEGSRFSVDLPVDRPAES